MQFSTIPVKNNLLLVNEAVLSNAKISTFAAKGILDDYVQKKFLNLNKSQDLITAIDKIIGNKDGTTVVIINMHLMNS